MRASENYLVRARVMNEVSSDIRRDRWFDERETVFTTQRRTKRGRELGGGGNEKGFI